MTNSECLYDRAVRAGKHAAKFEPRAVSAHVDHDSGMLCLNLTSGTTFAIPIRLIQGLSDARPDDLADIEVTPGGEGLHFEALDVDLSVPGLVSGVFGTKAWMKDIIGTTL